MKSTVINKSVTAQSGTSCQSLLCRVSQWLLLASFPAFRGLTAISEPDRTGPQFFAGERDGLERLEHEDLSRILASAPILFGTCSFSLSQYYEGRREFEGGLTYPAEARLSPTKPTRPSQTVQLA